MRHYYRFMELEPVLEQEEDSAGDASPTSSTGSPSLSPPPDAWAQLSGKEYHDALSNHLLQEHLELQRAYRMLEMQYRNCDTRASRDLQRLKEVLPNQERLREELQRAKEREAVLRGEIYDLQEQNELLEFRILELGECHENASNRGVVPETRDVETETSSGDVRASGPATSLAGDVMGHQERLSDEPQTPFTSADQRQTTSNPEHRQARASEHHEDMSRCHMLTSPTNHRQCSNHQNSQEEESNNMTQRSTGTKEVESLISSENETQIRTPSESECHPFSSNSLTSLSESISCTLCRRLPRRRSVPATSQYTHVECDSPAVESQREKESLRKSKSDGEIQVRYCSNSNQANSHPTLTKENDDKSMTSSLDGEQCSILVSNNIQRFNDGNHLDLVGDTGGGVKSSWRGSRYSPGVEEQVKTMRSMLNAIYDVLRETRVEVECTNSELREEVETLETTVQRLTEEVTRRGGETIKQELTPPPLVRRSRSLSFSKDCYCCSQELRPSLEDVITKLQQLMSLVMDKEPIPAVGSLVKMYELVSSNTVAPLPDILTTDTGENTSVAPQSKVLDTHTTVQNVTNIETSSLAEEDKSKRTIARQEIQTKENGLHPRTKQAATDGEVSMKNTVQEGLKHKEMWRPEPLVVSNDQESREKQTLPQKLSEEGREVEEDIPEDIVEKATEFYNSYHHKCFVKPIENVEEESKAEVNTKEMVSLPEEKTKPVLRRWREQLIVRRDRVQPWRIELLDFPKRQPSVV